MGTEIIIAAVLAAIASIAGSVYTNKSNQQLTRQSQEWQEEMQEKQNVYNTPLNQMDRLRSAGISPNALSSANSVNIGGNTSAGIGNVSAIPNIDPMSQMSNNMLSLMNSFNSSQQALSDMSLREYRIQQIEAETKQIQANTDLLGVNTQAQYIVNKYIDAEKSLALREGKSRIRLNRYQSVLINQQIDNLRFELYNILPEQKRKLVSETDNNILNLDYLQSLILSNEANIEKTKAETGLVGSQISKTETETQYTEQDIEIARQTFEKMMEVYSSEIKKMQAETNLTEEECFWKVFESIDKVASTSIMGNKVPYLRSGDRRTRKFVDKKLSERYGF